MQFVLFLFKKLKDKNSFFSFSRNIVNLSVSFCTFLITSIILILSGFNHEIKKNIFDFTGNYQFCKYNGETLSISDFSKSFSDLKGLRNFSPYVKKSVLIQCQNFVEGAIFWGLDIKDDENLRRYICLGKMYEHEGEIIVGKKLFERLRIDLDDKVIVFDLENESKVFRNKIVGVFETGIDELDDKVSLCHIGEIQKINSWSCDICEGVNINFDGNYGELRDRFYGGKLRRVESQYVYVMDWLKILEKNFILYIFIILCTILANVICILILQIFENKKLIDLLLSMGATSNQMGNIFILRNIKLVFRSMICGVGVAFVLGFLQMKYRFLGLSSSDYYLNFVPIYFDIKMVLGCLILMFLVLLLGLKITFNFVKKK